MCLFVEKIFNDDKIFYLYDIFFDSNRNFTYEHVKIQGFSCLNCSRFPGKVATPSKCSHLLNHAGRDVVHPHDHALAVARLALPRADLPSPAVALVAHHVLVDPQLPRRPVVQLGKRHFQIVHHRLHFRRTPVPSAAWNVLREL